MIGGEWYMDRFTDDPDDYIERKCPYCGYTIEIFSTDDMENIICAECGSTMHINQTNELFTIEGVD